MGSGMMHSPVAPTHTAARFEPLRHLQPALLIAIITFGHQPHHAFLFQTRNSRAANRPAGRPYSNSATPTFYQPPFFASLSCSGPVGPPARPGTKQWRCQPPASDNRSRRTVARSCGMSVSSLRMKAVKPAALASYLVSHDATKGRRQRCCPPLSTLTN